FCCNLPWNQTLNEIYMECKVFNDTKEGPYGFPLRNEDPLPDFRFALLCPEKTEDGNFKSNCDSGEEMNIENGCGDTSREDDMLHCLESPRTDCEARCVYEKQGVFSPEGQVISKNLHELTFLTVSSDGRFKHAVHHAVKDCLCKLKKIETTYGQKSLDSCALANILSYCIDYETSKHCPESSREDLDEERDCP
ncbi:Protein of unknown function, partial [Gryllus bimaculatus]